MDTIALAGRDGIRLAADVAGPPDGPPVLLFHGGGQTRHAWGTTLTVLGDGGFRAYSVDLRGHGESDWARGDTYELTTGIAKKVGGAYGLGVTYAKTMFGAHEG